MLPDKQIILEWIGKGDEDLLSLKALLTHMEGSPATGCFLAQQAVEKYLKALLIFSELEAEKTHDLPKIAIKLENPFPEIKQQFEKELSDLTRYYIETRYPGDYPEFSWEECQRAYEIASKIKEFVQHVLKVAEVI